MDDFLTHAEEIPEPDARAMPEPDATEAPLTYLLNFIDKDDPEKAGHIYTKLHRKLTNYFQMRGDNDPENAANITLDRAGVRIKGGAVVPDITPYCLGIARIVALERFREQKREQNAGHAFAEEFCKNNANEEIATDYRHMAGCLAELSDEDRKLLTIYCQRESKAKLARLRDKLAAEGNMTLTALRMRVHRLRVILADCVRRKNNFTEK